MRHRKHCQLPRCSWYCVMASRGEQGCGKALGNPENMSLGLCAECWSVLAEFQAWKLHTVLLTYTHSYLDVIRNARADDTCASPLLSRAESPEVSGWCSELAKEAQLQGAVSFVSEGSVVAQRGFKHLWKPSLGLEELYLLICIIVLNAKVFETMFQNSFWIFCITCVLMCHCCRSMKGLEGEGGKKKWSSSNVQDGVFNRGKIQRHLIFCGIRKWRKSFNWVNIHKLFQSWESCNPN